MSSISFASEHQRAHTQIGDQSFKAIALFCCCGLAASFSLMTLGIQLVVAG